MSSFRAINQPSESPPKHTSGERTLSDVVSRQDREADGGRAPNLTQAASQAKIAKRKESPEIVVPAKKLRVSAKEHSIERVQSSTARPWAAVVPQDNKSSDQSKGKGDIRQAVAKAKKAMHTPRKEKNSSKSSTSKARRHQAPREKKLMPSIEHSMRKRRASFTPDCVVDRAAENDYVPSSAATTLTSAANTPLRRSLRKHPSTCPSAGSSGSTQSSPQIGDTPAVIKRELTTTSKSAPNLEAIVTPRRASPSIWNTPVRRKRYKEAEFVELPKEVFEYEKSKKENKKAKREMRLKKEVMMAGKQNEKGKVVERGNKRMAEWDAEQDEPRKRHKSQKPSLEDQSITNDPNIPREEPQASKQTSARRSPKGKIAKRQGQRHKAVVVKAADRSDITDLRSHADVEARSRSIEGSMNKTVQASFKLQMPKEHAPRHRERERPLSEDRNQPYERREICVPKVIRRCSCVDLPEDFTSKPNRVPSLKTWEGSPLEFFEQVKQISCCRGSIHPPNVVDACRRMLRKQCYPNRGDEESLESMFDFANGFLSTNDRDDNHLMRAQSSIPPPTFYGYGQSYRPAPNARSSSRSAQTTNKKPRSLEESPPPKGFPTKSTPRKTLLVRERIKDPTNPISYSVDQHPTSPVVGDASSCPTLPFGKRRRLDEHRHQIFDDSPQGKQSVAGGRISRGPPEASSGRPELPASFSAERRRHQSAPVNLVCRGNAANERNLSTERTHRHAHPLQEIPNNAIVLSKLASLEKVVLERLPAAPRRQSAAALPATAPTAAAAAEGGNGAEQTSRKKRKRLSTAERKVRFPESSSDVPDNLRKTDPEIIVIGRESNGYKRHVSAPEAFGYSGRLKTEKNYLLDLSENGKPVWTAQVMRRLMR